MAKDYRDHYWEWVALLGTEPNVGPDRPPPIDERISGHVTRPTVAVCTPHRPDDIVTQRPARLTSNEGNVISITEREYRLMVGAFRGQSLEDHLAWVAWWRYMSNLDVQEPYLPATREDEPRRELDLFRYLEMAWAALQVWERSLIHRYDWPSADPPGSSSCEEATVEDGDGDDECWANPWTEEEAEHPNCRCLPEPKPEPEPEPEPVPDRLAVFEAFLITLEG